MGKATEKGKAKKAQKYNSLIRGLFYKLFCVLLQAICALRPTFEKLFTGAKVGRKAQKVGVGRKTVYEIDPRKNISNSVGIQILDA